MAGTTASIRIEGLRELNRALAKVNREVGGEVRDALKKAGEPVRQTAEQLAGAEIRNIGPTWSKIRTGSTFSSVYVAPAARRRGGSGRPNLGVLLLERALWPSAEQHSADTEKEVLRAFDSLVRSAGFH
jgi:hypothetical protein